MTAQEFDKQNQLLREIHQLSDEEIISLSKQMDLPATYDFGQLDRDKTISKLLNGGCEGCNKKK